MSATATLANYFAPREEHGGQSFAALIREQWRRFADLCDQHAGLYNQSDAAKLMGVSSQRVQQLVKAGRLAVVKFEVQFPCGSFPYGDYIPGTAVERWMQQPKAKGGRGCRAPLAGA